MRLGDLSTHLDIGIACTYQWGKGGSFDFKKNEGFGESCEDHKGNIG